MLIYIGNGKKNGRLDAVMMLTPIIIMQRTAVLNLTNF